MRQYFIPENLNMRQFGKDAQKVACILDYMYRFSAYKNEYGYNKTKRSRLESLNPVPICMKKLEKVLREHPRRIMDLICRHKQNKAKVVEVIKQVKAPSRTRHKAAMYAFTKEYRVKPIIFRSQRLTTASQRRRDKEKERAMIERFPENYQKVCGHIKKLSLAMNEEQLKDLISRIRNDHIQESKRKYIEEESQHFLLHCEQKMTKEEATDYALSIWILRREDEEIKRIDEEHYDSTLFLWDKFLELQHEDEFPIYGLDAQGRLHYYLTNMSGELRPYIRLDGKKMVSYDLGTSQCVFIWLCLRDYIRDKGITLNDVKQIADEIMDTIRWCDLGGVPDYIVESFASLKRKRTNRVLEKEMQGFCKLLGKDFYFDIMETVGWKKLPNGRYNRK